MARRAQPSEGRQERPAQRVSLAPPAVEQIRLTFFSAAEKPLNAPLWEQIAGSKPALVQEMPAQGMRQAVGPFAGGQLTAAIQQTRADYIISPVNRPNNALQLSKPATLGNLDEVEISMRSNHENWAKSSNLYCDRIAISLTLNWLTTSSEESLKFFNRRFPGLGFADQEVSDVFLQVNKPWTPASVSIRSNCMQKWAVAQIQIVQINPMMPNVQSAQSFPTFRLEIETNTPPEHRLAFDPSSSAALIGDMWERIHSTVYGDDQ